MLLWGTRELYRVHLSQNWPHVQGTVITSQLHTGLGKYGTGVEPYIRYRYTAGNERYIRTTITFGNQSTNTDANAQTLLNRYPLNSKVNVYYDPNNPDVACLEPGSVRSGTYIPVVFGIGFIGVGIAAFTLGCLVERGNYRKELRCNENRANRKKPKQKRA